MKILLLLLLVTTGAIAQKNSINGQAISSQVFNSSTLSVGSIQQSLLTLSQFQGLNGDCWKLMNGDSILGTDLNAVTQMTVLPDVTTTGRFLRQAVTGRALSSSEEDDNKIHTHTYVASYGPLGQAADISGFKHSSHFSPANNQQAAYQTVAHTNAINNSGTEARPKNIAVNMFVKVNKNCNFNP